MGAGALFIPHGRAEARARLMGGPNGVKKIKMYPKFIKKGACPVTAVGRLHFRLAPFLGFIKVISHATMGAPVLEPMVISPFVYNFPHNPVSLDKRLGDLPGCG